MSYWPNPSVIIQANMHCTSCGWSDTCTYDDGDRVNSDHYCPGFFDEDEELDEW